MSADLGQPRARSVELVDLVQDPLEMLPAGRLLLEVGLVFDLYNARSASGSRVGHWDSR